LQYIPKIQIVHRGIGVSEIMSLKETVKSINEKSISIEIFGLGYVGFPLTVRLASAGLQISGIDVNQERIKRLENNKLMDSEIHLEKEYIECRERNNIKLQSSPSKSSIPKIGIICVPTPIPTKDISSDVFVKSAVESFLNCSKPGDVIILESSIEVGTTEVISNIIEKNGYKVGGNFGLCFCPERIDPSNKEWGIENIPRVIYCSDESSFDVAKGIYQHVNKGNLLKVDSPKIAEIVKSFENAFRLVNITLVNELAILCDKLEINVKEVIDAAATKPFGFMPHYPGAGAGGHCIPKDPRFLLESAKKLEVKFDTIENALKINKFMPTYICNSIENSVEKLGLKKTILVYGLSYKANVEDMRDSPSFKIINELVSKGFTVFGYDPFFKVELIEKYLIENNITEFNCKMVNEINNETLKNISCICIVQHHSITENKLNEIYRNCLVPFIYDCQGKLSKNHESKTQLEFLGQ
jgi:UDP-N-acetyl-D-glucosamine dehydrogenase